MKNALIVLVALAFSFFALPTFAVELTADGLLAAYSDATLSDYLIQFIVEKIADNPVLSLFLLGLSSAMPLIGFIANRTANPIDNALLILMNKVLQTLSFNASKNQPDVLSWTEMLTNRPSTWPDILATNMMTKANELKERGFKSIQIK